MFTIVEKRDLADKICEYVFEAPLIAKKALPGQFVIIRIDEEGERIPLTLADTDPAAGRIKIVVQAIGTTTNRLHCLNKGDKIADIIGPLGTPSHLDGIKNAIIVGGGVGIACVHPVAKALKQQGANVVSIIGSRNKDLLFFEDEMEKASHKLIVTTDDGSKGQKALVTVPLKELLESGEKYDFVFSVGPVIMMREVAKATKPFGVKTIVSLNPVMVDGTGMCGACRVSVGGATKFGCVDGPDFDGHEVDFDLLMKRLGSFKKMEAESYEAWQKKGGCSCHK